MKKLRPKKALKKLAQHALPVAVRRHLARWLDRQAWLPNRNWVVMDLLRDWAERDPSSYHRFLWTNHLGYARYYESQNKFGSENILPAKKRLVEEVVAYLRERKLDPQRDIESILDVGSSSGYLLRYLETEVFTGARNFLGLDIDAAAIQEGTAYLASQGSRIHLVHSDLSQLEKIASGRTWDILFCIGVLMYLTEAEAASTLAIMQKSAQLVVTMDYSHPEKDNRELPHSETRAENVTWIHNVKKLIEGNGDEVVYWRQISERLPAGQQIVLVFSRSGQHAPPHDPSLRSEKPKYRVAKP